MASGLLLDTSILIAVDWVTGVSCLFSCAASLVLLAASPSFTSFSLCSSAHCFKILRTPPSEGAFIPLMEPKFLYS